MRGIHAQSHALAQQRLTLRGLRSNERARRQQRVLAVPGDSIAPWTGQSMASIDPVYTDFTQFG
jgi:hypothetical protein